MQDSSGLHHLHKRKRIFQKLEKYPSSNKLKRILDKLIYIIAICGPLVALPQVLSIWISKNVAGISSITWTGFLIISLFWLAYGIVHKEKPIIISNIIWILIYIAVILGVFIFQ